MQESIYIKDPHNTVAGKAEELYIVKTFPIIHRIRITRENLFFSPIISMFILRKIKLPKRFPIFLLFFSSCLGYSSRGYLSLSFGDVCDISDRDHISPGSQIINLILPR